MFRVTIPRSDDSFVWSETKGKIKLLMEKT